jgi:hypothetical protein
MSTTLPLSTPAIPNPYDAAFKDNYAESLINGIEAAQQAVERAQATFNIIGVEARTYTLVKASRCAFDVRQIGIQTDTGTCTANLKINSTSVTGMGSISVTSTRQTVDGTTGVAVAQGDDVTLIITSVSSANDLIVTLWGDMTAVGAS